MADFQMVIGAERSYGFVLVMKDDKTPVMSRDNRDVGFAHVLGANVRFGRGVRGFTLPLERPAYPAYYDKRGVLRRVRGSAPLQFG